MTHWQAEWLMVTEEGTSRIPAAEFLAAIEENVRKQLIAILDAVRQTGPDQWMDTNSHAAMHGDLDFCHEVRDKQGQMLYRLFVVWKRDDRLVVLVDGRKKMNNTAISDADYEKVAVLARSVRDGDYAIADGDAFARMAFEKSDEASELAARVKKLDADKSELEQLLDDATRSGEA